MAEVNIKLKLPSFRGKLVSIISAIIIGFVSGFLLWSVAMIESGEEFYNFLAVNIILYVTLSLFTLISYKRVANSLLYFLSHFLYLMFVIWTMVLTKTPDMERFLIIALLTAGVLFFSTSFIALANKEMDAVFKYYIHFIEEFNKVFTLSIIINLFIGVIVGLFIALLNTTFNYSESLSDLQLLVVTMSFTPIPFIVLAFTYDFKKPINEQTELRILNIIVSVVLTGGAFLIALLLGFYLLALSVSSFEPILETGDTSSTFLAMIASCLTLVYLSSQFVGRGMSRVLNYLITGMHVTLVLECFLMLCVAIYALGVRIDNHGITMNRMIGVLAMISISIILIKYAAILASALIPRPNISRYAAGLRFTIFTSILLTFFFTILVPMVVDFESLSLRMNYGRVSGNDDLAVTLDRAMFDQSGNKSVNFLEDKYEEETDLKMKADIIITLQRIRGDLSFEQDNGAPQNANDVLKDIAENEENTYLKSLGELNVAKGTFGRFYNDNEECKELVAELLDKDLTKDNQNLSKFCNAYQTSI